MRKLFFDLDQDDREYWANYVTNTGLQAAPNESYSLGPDDSFMTSSPVFNTPTVGLATPIKGNTTSTQIADTTVNCYQCQNGFAVGYQYTNECPSGWTTDFDPCSGFNSDKLVSCTSCDGGGPIMNMFPNSCPEGWSPEFGADGRPIDPCTDMDCWDCATGGKQRVTTGVACASANAIRVPVVNNSSVNPCSPDLGPETDCWNCTTGAVTRTQAGEECPGNNGDALYRVNILANGSSDNPCKKFSNYCYKCTDGVVESEIYQSDVESECPTGWTQDKKPCYNKPIPEPEPEPTEEPEVETEDDEPNQSGFLGGNTKYITFGVALLAVLMLMKKPSN